ncbi:MAG: gliding motility-associated C-terminal domain-containing protein [Bacteroidetes bacterium]|nr:gliding motility-associated C-terminal domain-containing protein [Bacteroidota bacterium]
MTQPAAITGTPAVVNVLCNGGNTGSITINGTAGGVGPYQYSLNAGPFGGSNVFGGLTAGTYTVTIRDANLCTVTLTNIVVNQPAVLNGTPVVVNVLCNGGNTGSITINPTTGGVGPYQYSLNAGPFGGSNVFGGLTAGTYTVTIRDANLCTRILTNIVVNQPAVITGTPAVVNVLCNGGNTGSITINGTARGVGPYQYSLNAGPFGGSNVFGGLTAGTYTVTIRDANLCTVTLTNIVVNQPAVITGTPAVVNVLCNGGNTGSITINGTAGGVGPYQYSLNAGPFGGSNVFGGLPAGTYTVTIRDANLCTVTLTNIVVNQPAAITGTPAVVNVLCNGGNTGSITINATAGGVGPYQYSLNAGPFGGSNVFGGLTAGTYTVTIRDANLCTVTLTNIIVNQPAVITGTPAVVNVLCNGGNTGSITINATAGGVGPYQYSLSGGPFQGSNVFGGLTAGTYTVTIRDANLCTVTLTNIVVNQPAVITGTPAVVNVTCGSNNGSITINGTSGGVGPYQYSLNAGPFQGSNVFGSLGAGTYTVTIRDANLCAITLTNIVVSSPAALAGTPAVVNVLCNGGNTGSITINAVSGGTGPYLFSLNAGPFGGSNVFAGLTAGTYSVTIQDANLCTLTLNNIVVNEPAAITGTPAVVNVLCNGGNTGSITINGTAGGVGPYQYSLNAGPFGGSNVFGGLTAGTYTVTIRDANLCTVTLTNIVVNEPAVITGTPAVVDVLCNGGNTGSITINATAGGVGPYQYSLSGGPFQGSNVFGGLTAGTYTVTIRDANLCTVILTNIVVNQPAVITGTPAVVNVTCGSNNGSITINGTSGGVGPYQYSLNAGPFQGSNVFGSLGAGTYTVTIRDANLCTITLTNIVVSSPAALAGTPAVVNVLCNGGNTGSITINAVSGGTGPYQFSLNAGPFGGSNVFAGLTAGTYSVTIQDANLCTLTLNNIVVNEPAAITGTPAVVDVLCNGGNTGSITINATAGGVGPYQYSLNAGPFGGSNVFGGLTAGTYTVTIRDANLCTVTLTNIIVNQPAVITGTPAVVDVLCNGGNTGSITINATAGGVGPYQYSLSGGPFQGSNVFGGLTAGTYTVTIRDANLCTVTLTNIVVNEPAVITGTPAVVNVTCGSNNGSITINGTSGGVGPYQYSLNAGPFQLSNVFGSLGAGTYTVTIRDANLCTITLTNIVVSSPAALAGTPAVVNVTCNGGNTGSITINAVSGGTGPYQFSLNAGPFGGSNVFAGLTAGTYSVTIQDANLCTLTLNNIVVNEPAAITGTPAVVDVLCNGGNTGSITINATAGGVGPYQYSLNAGPFAGSNVFGSLTAGTYTVTIRDANLCTVTLTNIVVNEPAVITGTPAVVDVLCNGGNTGSITINATAGGVGPYQYSLSGGPFQGSNVFGGLTAGTYTVTIRDANLCTVILTNIVVNEPAVITGTPAVVNVTCGSNNGSITINGTSGGVGPYQYSLNAGPFQLSNVFGSLAAGTYTVTIQDANLCTITLTNIVVSSPAALAGTPAVVNVTCNGGNTGSITINAVSGGTGPYLFSLNAGPFGGSNVFAGLTAGTYSVTIQDANLCTLTLNNIVVNEPAAITGTPAVVDVLCNGGNTGSITINATAGGVGPYQYSLNAGPFAGSNVFGSLTAGTYTVTIRDANLCTVTLTNIVVNEPAVITGTPASTDVTCNGANDGIVGLNGVTGGVAPYQYSLNGGPAQSGNTFSGLAPGTYSIGVTDTNGCVLVFNGLVVAEPAPLAANDSTVTSSCVPGNDGEIWILNTTGGTPVYRFSLDGGPLQPGNSFTGVSGGAHVVVVTDQNGCTLTLNVNVPIPGGLIATDSLSMVSCNTGSDGEIWVLATGSNAPFQYSLNAGPLQLANSFTGLPAGNYLVVTQDQLGCTDTLMVQITEPNALSAVDSVVGLSCEPLGLGEIWVNNAQGGTGPYQYNLNGGPLQSNPDFTALGAGTFVIGLTDANGCSLVVDTVVIDSLVPIQASIFINDVTCNGDANGEIGFLPVSGGLPPYSYSIDSLTWTNNNLFGGLSGGIYTVWVKDSLGCTFAITDTVGEPAALSIQPILTLPTCNSTSGSIHLTVTGGVSPYIYHWGNGSTADSLVGIGVGTYFLTVTDNLFCEDTLVVNLPANGASPVASIIASSNVSCFGRQDGWAVAGVSSGTAPFQFLWNTTVPSTNDTLLAVGVGVWTVQVTDSLGCTSIDSISITEPNPLALVLDSVAIVCFADTSGGLVVNVTGGTPTYSFLWNTGDTLSSLNGLGAGSYAVTATDANGCQITGAQTLTDPLPVIAGFNSNPTMPAQLQFPNNTVTFLNTSQNASFYAWAFGDGGIESAVDPLHTYEIPGTYCVTLTASDSAGCTDTVEICNCVVLPLELEIPNTFTPNNDGRNDFFEIVGIGLYPNNHLAVFNRWGNLVYEKDQYDNTWAGDNYKNGAPLPDGAYYYIFTTGKEGESDILGDIVIFR